MTQYTNAVAAVLTDTRRSTGDRRTLPRGDRRSRRGRESRPGSRLPGDDRADLHAVGRPGAMVANGLKVTRPVVKPHPPGTA